jgi:iron complex transport system substrate-binding protein
MAGFPRRIVSLLSSATEMLFAVGAGARVVGIGHECDWPPEACDRPRVTRSWIDGAAASEAIDRQVRERLAAGLPLYEVDGERLAALAPDLIVTQAQCDVCAVRYDDVLALVAERPSLRGARVVALAPTTLAAIFNDILTVGEAANALAGARRTVAELQARVARIEEATRGLRRPRTIAIEWVEPLMLAANWTPTLIELAGGEPGLVARDAHSVYGSWDQVVAYDPEVVLVSPCGFDLARSRQEGARLAALPGWAQLRGVRTGRVFVVDGNAYLNRSGPRIVDSLEIVAHLLHPDRAAPPACGGWARWDEAENTRRGA